MYRPNAVQNSSLIRDASSRLNILQNTVTGEKLKTYHHNGFPCYLAGNYETADMKRILTVSTRWEYYAANIAGMIVIIFLIIWFAMLAFDNGQVQFDSIFLWLGLLLMIIFPFAIISFFSSMKSVIVTERGLSISWSFQKHISEVNFSDVKELRSSAQPKQPTSRREKINDSFQLILIDGRAFEFGRSQFADYNKLKALVYKSVSKVSK
jgi:hypothetical protein